jgi:signal transduction histidine kinase
VSSYSVYLYLAPFATALVGWVAWATWQRRSVPGARGLLVLSSATLAWVAIETAHMLMPTQHSALVVSRLIFVVLPWLAPGWLAFALEFTGHRPLGSRLLWGTAAVGAVTTVLGLTMPYHNAIWTGYDLSRVDGLWDFRSHEGWWFWVQAGTAWIAGAYGSGLILIAYARSLSAYRTLSGWLVVGAMLPVAYNLAWVLDWIEVDKDFSSVAFALGSAAFAVGLFRFRLLDLRPTSRTLLVDRMSEALVVVDDRGRITDFNTAFASQFAPGIAPGDELAEVNEPLAGALEQDEGQVRLDPSESERARWFEWRAHPLEASDTAPGRVILLRDATQRLEAVDELRRAMQQVEARNDDLDAFARMAAHDLKSPLSGIRGYAYLMDLEGDDLTPELRREAVDAILTTADRMGEIIDELLLLASVRDTDVDLQPVDLASTVLSVRHGLGTTIAEREAHLTLPERWPEAAGHAPWVAIMWTNLVSNALKYGGRPPHLRLGADARGDRVRCWVEDNGPGIPDDQHEAIFLPFKRLHGDHEEDGHGIGLSIVQRISERLGGACGVEPVPSGGSRFWFELPATADAYTSMPRASSSRILR